VKLISFNNIKVNTTYLLINTQNSTRYLAKCTSKKTTSAFHKRTYDIRFTKLSNQVETHIVGRIPRKINRQYNVIQIYEITEKELRTYNIRQYLL